MKLCVYDLREDLCGLFQPQYCFTGPHLEFVIVFQNISFADALLFFAVVVERLIEQNIEYFITFCVAVCDPACLCCSFAALF